MLLACTIYSLHYYTMTYKGTFFTAWPTILTLPAPTTHREGDRFELVCSFTGVPAPEIRWEKDGSVFLLGGGGRSIMNSPGRSQLEINSLILITSCLRRKDTRLSTRYIFTFQESLGMRLIGRHNLPSLTSADKGKTHVTKSMGSDASLLCTIIFFPVVVPSPPKHQRMDWLNVQQKRLQGPSSFARDWSHY